MQGFCFSKYLHSSLPTTREMNVITCLVVDATCSDYLTLHRFLCGSTCESMEGQRCVSQLAGYRVFLLIFWPLPVTCGISVPQQELNLCPLHQKREVLTTGLPGKGLFCLTQCKITLELEFFFKDRRALLLLGNSNSNFPLWESSISTC